MTAVYSQRGLKQSERFGKGPTRTFVPSMYLSIQSGFFFQNAPCACATSHISPRCFGRGARVAAQIAPDAATAGTPTPGNTLSPHRTSFGMGVKTPGCGTDTIKKESVSRS